MNKETLTINEIIKEFINGKITILGCEYKGKGRPKKSDYVTLKVKDLRDYYNTCIFLNSFKTTYTNDKNNYRT